MYVISWNQVKKKNILKHEENNNNNKNLFVSVIFYGSINRISQNQ